MVNRGSQAFSEMVFGCREVRIAVPANSGRPTDGLCAGMAEQFLFREWPFLDGSSLFTSGFAGLGPLTVQSDVYPRVPLLLRARGRRSAASVRSRSEPLTSPCRCERRPKLHETSFETSQSDLKSGPKAGPQRRQVLRDVFAKGDAWFRSGDLLVKDTKGLWHFVDRIGDTFRRHGKGSWLARQVEGRERLHHGGLPSTFKPARS